MTAASGRPIPDGPIDNGSPQFDAAFRQQLCRLLVWRRDVRRFRAHPLPPGMLDRLMALACLAPSVGYSQPWRFVTVDDPARRRGVHALFEASNREAAARYEGEEARAYAALKLSGLEEAPHHLAVFAESREDVGRGLGRRTMPETAAYSVVTAIHTLWLAARAEGVGVGWVSILDPAAVTALLAVPPSWQLIAYLCIGWPRDDRPVPELERLAWERRQPVETLIIRR